MPAFVARVLARQAAATIAAFQSDDVPGADTRHHYDAIKSLAEHATHHPSGDAFGALLQAATVRAKLDDYDDEDPDVRMMKRALGHIIKFLDTGNMPHGFDGYFYVSDAN